MEIPAGKVPVADREGGVPGFVDAAAAESPEGYPPLDLPSEAQAYGLEVTDANGNSVGYLIEGFGFVPSDVAESRGGFDGLVAEREAELAELPDDVQTQIEDFHSQMEAEAVAGE